MDWLRKAPTALVVTLVSAVALATIAYLVGYVYLEANGADTTGYRALLNTAFNYLTVLFGAATTAASVSAARSSSKAEDNTNGTLTALRDEVRGLQQQLGGQGEDAP
jgi:type IV secretory pathway VirB10-like protein